MATSTTVSDMSLEGEWKSFYRYPSSGRKNDAMWGRHTLRATWAGDKLHFESVPGSKSQVVIDVAPARDDTGAAGGNTSTYVGTWHETTDPTGYYKGAGYGGTIELKLAANGQRLSGVWHGQGKDAVMNSDIWELAREGVADPTGAGQNS